MCIPHVRAIPLMTNILFYGNALIVATHAGNITDIHALEMAKASVLRFSICIQNQNYLYDYLR